MARNLTSLAVILAALACAGCNKPFCVTTNGQIAAVMPPAPDGGPVIAMALQGEHCEGPKVAIVDVDGMLLNMDMVGLYSLGENPVALFRERLERAAADPCVMAIVVRINSPGGGVTASDIMWNDLLRFKAKTGKPVVACLMDTAAGGAYMLATAADQIVAHPTSVTGGIGVILNLYHMEETMAQFNIFETAIKAGENIDIGTPVRPATDEQRDVLQAMADEFHERFKRIVHESRAGIDASSEQLFDGRIFTAEQAAQLRLVDHVGYMDDAVDLARQLSNCPAASVVLLHRRNDKGRTHYAITPNMPLQGSIMPFSIPGLDRSRLPTFLYLWQAEPTLQRLGGH